MAVKARGTKRKAPATEHARSLSGVGEPQGPNYAQPPVDEVVCGVRFQPLADFKLPHMGLLWNRFRSKYPKIEHVAPIGSSGGLIVDTATGGPIPRLWFINEADDELVQFQVDQLYFNWRRREAEYPRYKTILPNFVYAKNELDELLKEIGHPPLAISERELTYINRIPQGDGWESIVDLSRVISCLPAAHSQFKFLPAPKNLAWTIRFDLPDANGVLDVKLSQGKRKSDGRPILMLQLSTIGKAKNSDWDETVAWFNLAHKWIVNGFADMTTNEVQRNVWRREDVA